jgi:hypothetical protein
MQALQCLAQHLGRQPTLEELFMYLGADPSGTPQPPRPFPGIEPDEDRDGRLTALLRARDAIDRNPEILRVREEMIRRLLFGDLLGTAHASPLLGPSPHEPQGGKPFHLGPHSMGSFP